MLLAIVGKEEEQRGYTNIYDWSSLGVKSVDVNIVGEAPAWMIPVALCQQE